MKKPFVFITIPIILGIIFAYYFKIGLDIILYLGIILFIFCIYNFIKNKSSNNIIFILLVFFGIILFNINIDSSILFDFIEEDLIFTGIVERISWQEDGESKYIINIININNEIESLSLKEKTVLKVIGERTFQLGDEIVFSGKLRIPMENTNPKLYNYRKKLLADKIYTTITIKDNSIVNVNSENKGFKYKIMDKFRHNIEETFDKNLNFRNSSLMKSIILGEYSYLDEENILQYRDLGIAHILAVSGLHIGIITGFIILLLSNLGIKKKKTVLITLTTIWFYGYLIGFPASLLRANIMLTILLYSQVIAEPYDSINSLFVSMFILLIINPFFIFDLGFQLSYLSTFSIIYFTPGIIERFYPYRNKLVYSISGILGVQIGLLPVQAYYFNKIPVLSIFSNLIITPILSLSLVIGSSMVGFSYIFSFLNSIIGKILDIILNIQFELVAILYKLPYGIISCYSPNIGEIIIYYILILLLFKIIDINKLKADIKKVIIYYLILYTIFSSINLIADKSLEVHFIDVGQGDSILIKSKSKNYLVDTGGNVLDSFDIGENITLPYLKKHGVRKIEGIFITHFHDDHCKALPLLIDNLDIKNVLISYENKDHSSYNHIIKSKTPLTILKEGDKIVLDKNTSIEILSPTLDFINKNLSENDLSLVCKLKYYDKTILFTGDMEKQVEDYLIDKINEPVDIIKVPHHGSNTSSTMEFLELIKPEIAVITVGRNNFHGHPREEILDRYNEVGTKIYRTDTMGMVRIRLDKDDLKIYPYLTGDVEFYKLIDENMFILAYYIIYYLITYILIKIYTYKEELEPIGL